MVYYDNLELTENQYNTYILNKYLTKYYGQDKAIETIKNNIIRLDRIAYALGKKDLSFFCYITFKIYLLLKIQMRQDNYQIVIMKCGIYLIRHL